MFLFIMTNLLFYGKLIRFLIIHFFALNQSVSNTNTSGQLTIWNDLSPGNIGCFLFFICWVLVTQQLPENWVLQTEHLRIELNQLNGK